jgi:hypothetical protein
MGMAISVLVIIACLAGVAACWWLRGEVVGLMVRTDELVRSGTELAHTRIDGAERLVGEARQEVGRVEEKIQAALARVDGPRMAAQFVRRELREGLEPRLTKMREQIAPLRDTLTVASGFVDVLVSVESVRDRAVWLQDIQLAFDRLEELGEQVRSLAESLDQAADDDAREEAEPVTALTRVATEIDGRLVEIGELTAGLRERVDIVEADARKFTRRVTWITNISAILLTLIQAWIIYSQWVVIQRLRIGRFEPEKWPATR